MKDMTDSPLYKMMHPKSVAFWGASKDPTAMGSFQLAQLLALGFRRPGLSHSPARQGSEWAAGICQR